MILQVKFISTIDLYIQLLRILKIEIPLRLHSQKKQSSDCSHQLTRLLSHITNIMDTRKPILTRLDFFQFSPSKRQSTPETVICSLILWVILLALFILKLTQVASGKVERSSQGSSYNSNPSPTVLTADGTSFMMAIQTSFSESANSNLLLGVQSVAFNSTSSTSSFREVGTEKCTPNHWKAIPNLQSTFNMMNMQNWNCLVLNTQLTLQTVSNTVEISLVCLGCTTAQTITATLHLMNPLIDPNNHSNFHSYSISNQQLVVQKGLTSRLTIRSHAFTLSTDSNSMPWTSTSKEEGTLFSFGQIQQSIDNNQLSTLAVMTLSQSPQSFNYYRSTYGLFDVFAYTAGVALFLLVFLFLFRWFAQSSAHITDSWFIYREKTGQSYNIGQYIAQGLLRVIKPMGLGQKWQQTDRYAEVEEKMRQLQGPLYLEKRIAFIEAALKLLFEDHQLKALHLAAKLNLHQAYQDYQTHDLNTQIARYFKQKKDQQRAPAGDDFFVPNCSDINNPQIKKAQSKPAQQSQKHIIVDDRVQTEIGELENNPRRKSSRNDPQFQLHLQQFLDNQPLPKEQGDLDPAIIETVKKLKTELELLKVEASREGQHLLSKKLYEQLEERNHSLLYLLFHEESVQGQQRQLNPSLEDSPQVSRESNPSFAATPEKRKRSELNQESTQRQTPFSKKH